MKKLLFSLLTSVSFTAVTHAQIKIAPEVGINMANMLLKDTSGTKGTSLKAGFTAGAIVELKLAKKLFLQPGLFYMMNGAKNSVGSGSITVHTLQVPVNVEYQLGDPSGTRFFVGAGPYLGVNLGGNIADSNGNKTALVISSDTGSYNIKPIDFGAGINVGVILANNFYARIRYQVGFANLEPDARYTATTSAIGITVGYYFEAAKHHKSKHTDTK